MLTCIVNEKNEQLVVLCLYTEKGDHHLWKSFQLESTDRLNDRCRKSIEGTTGLFFMELVQEHNDKGEIFGTRSVPERKVKSIISSMMIDKSLRSYGLKNSMK